MGIRNLNLRKSQVRKKRDWFLPSSTYTYPPPPTVVYLAIFNSVAKTKLILSINNIER